MAPQKVYKMTPMGHVYKLIWEKVYKPDHPRVTYTLVTLKWARRQAHGPGAGPKIRSDGLALAEAAGFMLGSA